ncbi:unnamed protein product [Mucor hiemalis]
MFATFSFRTPDDIFKQFFNGQDPFQSLFDDSFNAGIGSRTAQDPFFSNSFNHPVNNININNLGSFNNGVSGASRSVSTTTSIVNGRKHTVTKIQDMNGTRVIEEYDNGHKRVTVNGVEEPTQQNLDTNNHKIEQYHLQSEPYHEQHASNRLPYTSDLNRQYGDHMHAYDEEDNSRNKHKSPLHQLLSRICCCL